MDKCLINIIWIWSLKMPGNQHSFVLREFNLLLKVPHILFFGKGNWGPKTRISLLKMALLIFVDSYLIAEPLVLSRSFGVMNVLKELLSWIVDRFRLLNGAPLEEMTIEDWSARISGSPCSVLSRFDLCVVVSAGLSKFRETSSIMDGNEPRENCQLNANHYCIRFIVL